MNSDVAVFLIAFDEAFSDLDMVKENALAIIRDELRRKVRPGILATGSMSDPYNPFEKELCLTRHALELVNACDFGVTIATKSPLVSRDIDILKEIAVHSPVLVKITITAADDALSRKIEPHAAVSGERFAALKTLSENKITCGVLLMPVLPFITDTDENVLGIVKMAQNAGARFIYPAFGMTLRQGQREYFYRQLNRLFPGMKEQYQARYGNTYSCASPRAKALRSLFSAACDKAGLLYRMEEIIRCYQMGYGDRQLTFFT